MVFIRLLKKEEACVGHVFCLSDTVQVQEANTLIIVKATNQ